MKSKIALSFAVLITSYTSFAATQELEPPYCQPQVFLSHKVAAKSQIQAREFGTLRLHAFEFGKTRLVGLAVGLSIPYYVQKLATHHSTADKNVKYCTWYFNKWNPIAEKEFNWKYLPIPLKNPGIMVKTYEQVLSSSFDSEIPNFISCLEEHKYLAMGCNNMQHRGPSVFAMLLAYSGCSAKNATDIANHLWGLNGIPYQTRLAIAEKGNEMGRLSPLSKLRLQKVFMGLN